MRVTIRLDVRQETFAACLLIGPPGDRPTKEACTFRTVTLDLEALFATGSLGGSSVGWPIKPAWPGCTPCARLYKSARRFRGRPPLDRHGGA